MVYSASSARTLLQGDGDGTAYLVKYLVYGAVGLVAMQRDRAPGPRRACAATRRTCC